MRKVCTRARLEGAAAVAVPPETATIGLDAVALELALVQDGSAPRILPAI